MSEQNADTSPEYILYEEPKDRSFVFINENSWIIKMDPRSNGWKIKFNTEDFPDFAPDDFAKEFVRLVESSLLGCRGENE